MYFSPEQLKITCNSPSSLLSVLLETKYLLFPNLMFQNHSPSLKTQLKCYLLWFFWTLYFLFAYLFLIVLRSYILSYSVDTFLQAFLPPLYPCFLKKVGAVTYIRVIMNPKLLTKSRYLENMSNAQICSSQIIFKYRNKKNLKMIVAFSPLLQLIWNSYHKKVEYGSLI